MTGDTGRQVRGTLAVVQTKLETGAPASARAGKPNRQVQSIGFARRRHRRQRRLLLFLLSVQLLHPHVLLFHVLRLLLLLLLVLVRRNELTQGKFGKDYISTFSPLFVETVLGREARKQEEARQKLLTINQQENYFLNVAPINCQFNCQLSIYHARLHKVMVLIRRQESYDCLKLQLSVKSSILFLY